MAAPMLKLECFKGPCNLISDLYEQAKTGRHCDVIIPVGEEILFAHSCVLASASDPLDKERDKCTALNSAGQRVFDIGKLFQFHHDEIALLVRSMLEFVYTGRAYVERRLLNPLSELASVCGVNSMETVCLKKKAALVRKRKQRISPREDTVEKISREDSAASVDGQCSVRKSSRTVKVNPKYTDVGAQSGGEPEDPPDEQADSAGPKDARIYKCPDCDYEAKSGRQLGSHQEEHLRDENKCRFCLLQATDVDALDSHISADHTVEAPYHCRQCGDRFQLGHRFRHHMLSHGEGSYACPVCSKKLRYKSNLKSHIKLCHTAQENLKYHACDTCAFKSKYRAELNSHKRLHTGEMLKCTKVGCSFKTLRKSNLKAHIVSHNHKKLHVCNICHEAFAYRRNLNRHTQHHDKTSALVCQQPGCGAYYYRKDKMKDHMYKAHRIGTAPGKRKTVDELLKESNKLPAGDAANTESQPVIGSLLDEQKDSFLPESTGQINASDLGNEIQMSDLQSLIDNRRIHDIIQLADSGQIQLQFIDHALPDDSIVSEVEQSAKSAHVYSIGVTEGNLSYADS